MTKQHYNVSVWHAGMDSVRNMTGSPISGIDPHELLDVRDLSSGAVHPSAPSTFDFPPA
jgi:sulfite reductase beta subunit-like hemoprotein